MAYWWRSAIVNHNLWCLKSETIDFWKIQRPQKSEQTSTKKMENFANLDSRFLRTLGKCRTFTEGPLGDLKRKLLNVRWFREPMTDLISQPSDEREVGLQVFKNYVNVASKWVPFSKWFLLNQSISSEWASLNEALCLFWLWRADSVRQAHSLMESTFLVARRPVILLEYLVLVFLWKPRCVKQSVCVTCRPLKRRPDWPPTSKP